MNMAERARLDMLARRRTVKGWAFRKLTSEESEEIQRFLEGGPVPKSYEKLYHTCRQQLGLE